MYPNATVRLYLGPTLGWVDITQDVRGRPAQSGGGITITRGRPDEGADTQLTRCSLVIKNTDGKYSSRNPLSPYYGLLTRNTPIMVSVDEADVGGAVALTGPAVSPASVTTPAHASLNGTGDLDVRVWARIPNWANGDGFSLAGRYLASGTDRAWYMSVNGDGLLQLAWSPDGTLAARVDRTATVEVAPAVDGALAVRATLTVATGVVRFYQAPTMAGPWTQLGPDASPAGATSVAAAAGAGVELGYESSISSPAAAGELLGFQLRTGGTLVASPDFTTLQPGATSLTDAQGRVWSLSSSAVAIDRGARFVGEVPSWPTRWTPGGADVWVTLDAAGITRRLGQGNSPVLSPLVRTLTRENPAAYLPLEDGRDATRPSSAASGVGSGTSFLVNFGADDSLAGAGTAAVLADQYSRMKTGVANRTGSTWSVMLLFKLGTAFPAATPDTTFLRIKMAGGNVATWEWMMSTSGYRWVGYDAAGNTVDDQALGQGAAPATGWVAMATEWSQVGGQVQWRVTFHAIGSDVFYGGSGGYPYAYTGTLGRVQEVEVLGGPLFVDMAVSSMIANNKALPLYTDGFRRASAGYVGEAAGERIARLCAEEGVPVAFWGGPAASVPMGRQPVVPLLDVLKDAARTDGGILVEGRGHLGLTYRTRVSLYNQTPLSLDYTAGHIHGPFEPTDDDAAVRNDVTVSRPAGGSAQAVQTTGPLSTAPPPGGVGTYDTTDTVNVSTDDLLDDHASWRLHLGTVDEARYPRIGVNLMGSAYTRNQTLTQAVALRDAGDVVSIGSLPAWLPPGPARVMVQGYTETIDAFEWSIVWNGSPASPWDVAVAGGPQRAPADGSTLGSTITATAMTLQITSTTTNGVWTTDPASFPMDIRVGAERITLSGISGSTSPQTATVVAGGRGLNGVVRSWPAGTQVNVWQPAILPL